MERERRRREESTNGTGVNLDQADGTASTSAFDGILDLEISSLGSSLHVRNPDRRIAGGGGNKNCSHHSTLELPPSLTPHQVRSTRGSYKAGSADSMIVASGNMPNSSVGVRPKPAISRRAGTPWESVRDSE